MAGIDAVRSTLGKNDKNGIGTQFPNGLATPGTTPALEDGRVEADNARRAAEAAAQAPQNPQVVTAQVPQNPQGATAANEEEVDNSGEYHPPKDSQEEENAIQRILSLPSNKPRKILGVGRIFDTPAMQKTAIVNAFRDVGTLIHPDYTNSPGAEAAFDSK
jgi:hypothetical protein